MVLVTVCDKDGIMIEYMLNTIICREFEEVVGKDHHEDGKAMHIGFSMTTRGTTDQYHVCHMYVFAPCNYVHVATQMESIDNAGNRHVGKMEHLGYHDSCWRDSISRFIYHNSDKLTGFSSFKLFDWYNVLTLNKEEIEYLSLMDKVRHAAGFESEKIQEALQKELENNPFDKRGIWVK